MRGRVRHADVVSIFEHHSSRNDTLDLVTPRIDDHGCLDEAFDEGVGEKLASFFGRLADLLPFMRQIANSSLPCDHDEVRGVHPDDAVKDARFAEQD